MLQVCNISLSKFLFLVYYVIHEAMRNTVFKKSEEREERGELEKK
jgi:hypothetical protein